ncbi:F-box domain-containing protein [Meloidogyne graminicola]|uniref:F-box domain-containing protein n=1 Tax=Meloidogyne graminicola TaxID=189291 RepID=A0A8T0A1K4_9BILA|nr:F-box domain-containing protein [Meloidogyne graminicola]
MGNKVSKLFKGCRRRLFRKKNKKVEQTAECLSNVEKGMEYLSNVEKGMEYLSNEILIKILKNLNYYELSTLKQTCRCFNEFINKYNLARKKFFIMYFHICILRFVGHKNVYLKHDSKAIDFPLSNVLQEKWQSALDQKMPLFITNNIYYHYSCNSVVEISLGDEEELKRKIVKFPLFPKSIEDLKIVRYWLKRLFLCNFIYLRMDVFIFNPDMVKLLFDNDEFIKMKFNCQEVTISIHKQPIDIWNFLFDYLVINRILIITFDYGRILKEDRIIILEKLINEGYRFPEVFLNRNCEPSVGRIYRATNLLILYNQLINHLETATDLTKMVNKIRFHCGNWSSSEIIVKGVELNEDNNGKKSYKLTNINNPNMKFSIKWTFKENENEKIKEIEISKIK